MGRAGRIAPGKGAGSAEQPLKNPERRSIFRVGPKSTWTTVLPVAFIIVSLLSLAVLPVVFSRRTQRMRREITSIAEPARREANEIQTDLWGELDKVIAFQVTGQAHFSDDYSQLVAQQHKDYELLTKIGPQLGPEVGSQLALLMSSTSEWHASVVNGDLLKQQLPSEVFLTRLFERHPSYEAALGAAAHLEVAIQDSINDRLKRMRNVEQLSTSLTIILTLLALTSAMLVAGLGRRMRLLAGEAMRRRQESEGEAADAKLARAAAEREERRAAFLATAGQELASSLDYQHAVSTLARLVVPNLAAACCIDVLESDGALRRVAAAHHDPERHTEIQRLIGRSLQEAPEALARVMSSRDAHIIGPSPSMLTFLGERTDEQRSLIVVPLVSRGQTFGAVTAAAPLGRVFAREDASLLAELARHASLAIDNARLYLESQQALRAREEVLAIVSHDLRNPLSAVTLAASLLQVSQTLSEEDREELDLIDLSANRMRRLIEDLLDVTRLEGGKRLPIEPAPIAVETLFQETFDLFNAQAASSKISLCHHMEGSVPDVYADRHRVLQVLSNLIGNALKFTPAGGTISFQATGREQDVLFSVTDSGPGIPKENLGDIFNPYWQAKRTERLGAGLGLPIAKGVIEAHGGAIWAESEPGLGTSFFFTLPVARPSVMAAAPLLSAN